MNQKTEDKKRARRAAREAVFELLYETEFHEGDEPAAIYELAAIDRDLAGHGAEEAYIRETYFGVMARRETVDALIGRHARGWKTNRLSRVSRAVLRLGAYELAYAKNIPAPVVINEAVELSKKFDDPKARAFINGVLNAIKNELNGDLNPTNRLPSEKESRVTEGPAMAKAVEQVTVSLEIAPEENANE